MALAALFEWVRAQVRAADEIVVDPTQGLGIVIRSDHPDAPGIVAERLRTALASGAEETHGARQQRRARRAAETGAAQEQVQAMLRLGVGYAAFTGSGPRSADASLDAALEATIRAACRPRMLISLPLEALSPRVPPARAARADIPAVGGAARGTSQQARDMSSSDQDAAGETAGAPRLRLVRLPYGREKESAALRERARLLGVPFAHLPAHLPSSCRRALAPELAREVRAVAIGRTRSTLTVAMDDPRDANAVLRLRAATGLAIFPVLAPAQEIARALAQFD